MNRWIILAVAAVSMLVFQDGCASKPPAQKSGFLSTYSNLQEVNESRMVYRSPKLAEYDSFMIDSIEFTMPPQKLTPEQRAEVAKHFNKRLVELVQNAGLTVTTEPGVGVARVQV